jgi:hypothetical protein
MLFFFSGVAFFSFVLAAIPYVYVVANVKTASVNSANEI